MDGVHGFGRTCLLRGRQRWQRVAGLVGVTVLSASLSVLLVSAAGPAAAAPGTPGTPQPPTTVFEENFQNRPGPTPIVRLTGYTGTTGQTYSAAAPWLAGCNGWIASANEATTAAGGASAQVTDCASQGNWNAAQQLAQALGMAAGQTAVAARDNYAVSAYTANQPGAGLIEFQTATNIPFATSNRFITFSVDVAAVNCTIAPAPVLQFSLLNDVGTAIPAGSQINACTSPTTVIVPALGAVGAAGARVGTYTANGSVLITGSSIGVRMVNVNGGGGGNDHGFDNITILDVTPQLDKSFSPTVVGVGQPSTLTFTVTNTDELASKNGWSFTDNLPAGLTIVGPATTTCPSGVVTAPLGGSTVAVTGNLSAGMASCTVRVNVTSTTLGPFTNDASNISPRSGVNPPGTTTVTFTQQPALSIVKSSTTVTIPPVGQTIPYQFRITNTGNVTMTAITVTDPNTTGVSCEVTTLAPGAAMVCLGSHTVTQADLDAGAVVNTATVVGTPPIGPAIPPVTSNRLTILATQLPALSILKSSTTVTIPPVGQTIPYQFVVTNTGNVTMTAIVVTDPNTSGVNCPTTTLTPGVSTTCTGSHTVVQADIDNAAVVNRASVIGTPPSGTAVPPVPSNEVTITGLPNPALSIVKASTTTQLPVVGATIPYTFLVTNIGDVTMSAIAVTDPNTATGVSCPVSTLAPGVSTTCTGNHNVTQADIDVGRVVNTATVIGTPPNAPAIPPVTSNQITIPGLPSPALSIVKASTTTAIRTDGEVVPYTFAVTNTGNLTMSAITVTDPNATDIFCPAFTLAPGISTTCTGNHTVVQADLDAGALINRASVVGTPPGVPPIEQVFSNEITIPAAQTESLSILKSSTIQTLPPLGATIPYEFAVTNTGNVTMTGIVVTDPNAPGISCPVTTLAPSAVTTCTGTHTITQADIDNGEVINTATVVGTPPDRTPIPPMPSNQVRIPGVQNPALSIIKASTTTAITSAGQNVPYTFTVTNTGNTTITATAVTDPTIAGISCPQTTLGPGTATVCTATYTVTAADLDAGRIVNTATVTGTPPNASPLPAVTSNTVTIPAAPSPSLSIIKSSTTTQATAVGEVIAFTFVVTNTGNVTISNIVVTDPKVGLVTCPQTTLAAGAAMTCAATYTITEADVTAGHVVNTATVAGTPPNGAAAITPVVSNQVFIAISSAGSTPTTTTTTTTAPTTTTTTPRTGQLPATGSNIATTLRTVGTLTLLGTALVAIARRRNRTTS